MMAMSKVVCLLAVVAAVFLTTLAAGEHNAHVVQPVGLCSQGQVCACGVLRALVWTL
ncbi:hypothetical protein KC19_VG077600 [Ceratodon purpureus]|uniref:Uncharacterized protein n=1 Tax=Ceratodon purpureus TaxID=3225 RepID=A0A8T0HN34_CERPU|nr:hypothetical protein KC19_VG077600 [Ceratodon purpureus]